jgi:ubiquinone/menaquinone biosynthesis C-methylase UbiE
MTLPHIDPSKENESDIQRRYYAETASEYDDMHLESDWQHSFALHLLTGYIEFYKITSVLDVGAGTGRTMTWLKQKFPALTVKGVEPVEALRERGYAKGLLPEDLVDGNGYELPFQENSFELVCEFAVLHHVREPNRMIREMNRVASRAVAISDCNFVGQGSFPLRLLKLGLFLAGLWPVADWMKTRGKGYTISEGDGLAYSYSVYQGLGELKKRWRSIRFTTAHGRPDSLFGPIATAGHLFLFASDADAPP